MRPARAVFAAAIALAVVACTDAPVAIEAPLLDANELIVSAEGVVVDPARRGLYAPPQAQLSVSAASGSDVILPSALATTMGLSNNIFPHSLLDMRYQQVFLGAEIGGPHTFRELCLRPDDQIGSQALVQQITLKLGPTTFGPSNIGLVFGANYSAPPTEARLLS